MLLAGSLRYQTSCAQMLWSNGYLDW